MKRFLGMLIAFMMLVNIFNITTLTNVSATEENTISNEVVLASAEYTPEECFEFENGIITGYNGFYGSVIIPPKINGVAVTQIGSNAFAGNSVIGRVVIPEGVTTIGDEAFLRSELISVTIPKSVTAIGYYAFDKCYNLIDVYYSGTKAEWDSIATYGYHNELDAADLYCTDDVEDNSIVVSGTDNDYLTWTINGNGLLTISGNGENMKYGFEYDSYNGTYYAPWKEHADKIRSVIIGDGIINIAEEAFSECHRLKSITISDSVTSIDALAFNDCYTLSSITIPSNVTTIGYHVFLNCRSLTSITIQGSNTTIDLGEDAFLECNALLNINVDERNSNYCSENGVLFNKDKTKLLRFPSGRVGGYTIPDSVTTIGEYAFSNCTGLTNITIPDSVLTIDEWAFSYCFNLSGLILPSSVITIGGGAFDDCDSISSIEIPGGITSIGYATFSSCNNLTSVIIPKSVTNIESYAFGYSYKITDVYYTGSENEWNAMSSIDDWLSGANIHYNYVTENPNVVEAGMINENIGWKLDDQGTLKIMGVGAMEDDDYYYYGSPWDGYDETITTVIICNGITSILKNAFSGLYNLTSVTIPDSITTIGDSAFAYCESLESITIPSGVTSIGTDVFYFCDGLSNINVSEQNTIYTSIDGVLHSKDGTILMKCPIGKTTESYTISNSVTTVANAAFSGCRNIKSITIPDSVTSIGDAAFASCYNMSDIHIGNSVASIGYSAFNDCYALSSVTIPDSVTTIGDSVFAGCESLTTVNVGSGNTSYISVDGVLLTKDKKNLLVYPMGKTAEEYTIPSSVTSISPGLFSGCENLKSIIIPDTVTDIGEGAFISCYNLSSIVIPNSVTTIGDSAFFSCDALASITIPDSVTNIGQDAFSYTAYYNNSENWENGVLYIGSYLISGKNCSGEYSIKPGTKVITDNAFGWCDNLTSAVIPEGVSVISDYAFYSCSSLTSITIPKSVTSIDADAFNFCYDLANVYYAGSENEWDSIQISTGNEALTNANIQYAGESSQIVAKGECGNELKWTLNEEGKLTVKGNGEMYNYSYDYYTDRYDTPWYDYADTIKSVVIKNGVTTIGNSAFYDCTNLTNIVIPDTLIAIGVETFSSCTGLTNITIPEGVTTIGWGAFKDCSNLKSIVIPNSVTSISHSTFYRCNSLTSIEIPNSVNKVNYGAFYECTALKDVYYSGNQNEWSSINVEEFNTYLTDANIHYNSSSPIENEIYFSKEGKNVNITSANTYSDATVIVASYDISGRVLFVQSKITDIDAGTTDINFSDFDISGADTIKVMVWESLISAVPLFDVYTISAK